MALIVLGVASSIGIYKACEVARGFQRAGHDVQVIMTRNATELISPFLFSSLTGRRTIAGLFDPDQPWSVAHVALAKESSLLVVAPATANVLAKLASGIADDFLSTFALAFEKPVLVAPAMNEAMLANPRTRENLRALRARGVEFVEPGRGYLACGDEGWGRLADPEAIVRRGLALLDRGGRLAGKTVLVTAGPTREPVDAVRFLSNRSSGKMGFAMAREALRRGARVILIAGPTAEVPPRAAEIVRIETAADMFKETLARASSAEIVVMAAAVADVSIGSPLGRKIKKTDMPATLALVPTPDILAALGERKAGRFLVGFAAETEDLRANARRKLEAKHLDLIIANDVSRPGTGFDADDNEAVVIGPGIEAESGRMSKPELSRFLWDAIEDALGKKA